MSYQKQNWQDRQVQYPLTFTMTQNENGTVTLTPYPGTIGNEGTKITADRMLHIEDGIYQYGVPTGTIVPFAGNQIPNGWLLCNGQSVSQSTYSDLYQVLGSLYGSATDGNFVLPNIKGKFIVGINSSDSSFNTLGKTGGEKTHTLTITEMPSHVHALNTNINCTGFGTGNSMTRGAGGTTEWKDNEYYIKSTGGGAAHNNLPPYITMNYIIKT